MYITSDLALALTSCYIGLRKATPEYTFPLFPPNEKLGNLILELTKGRQSFTNMAPTQRQDLLKFQTNSFKLPSKFIFREITC